jgi:TP901 family phage tail tape measure protein
MVVKLRADAGGLQKDLSGAQKMVRGFTKNVQTIGKTALIGGLAAVGGGVLAVKKVMGSTVPMARSFESSLADLNIAARDSGMSMDQLHDAAMAVGGDASLLGVSASGAAESMTGLYKAGLSSTEIFGDLQGYMAGTAELGGALRASIDLAAASELDMTQASDLASVALSTFGGSLETAEERADFVNKAMNNMVQAADASVAEVSGLAEALKNVGPTASSLGIGIEDTNNALAILSTRGIKGSEAGTALKSMLTNLNRPTKKVQSALDELNVSLYDSEGAFVGMPSIVEQMETAMAGLTDEQKSQYIQTIAGTYGMNALNTLIEEGTEGWNAMADATSNAAGIQEQAAAKAATLDGVMEALGGVVESIKIGIGEAFIPVLKGLATVLTGIAETVGPKLTDFFQNTLGPIFEKVGLFAEKFFTYLELGESPLDALRGAFAALGLYGVANQLQVIATKVTEFIAKAREVLAPIFDWVSKNIELKDVLIALGIAIAAVVLPALWGVVTTLAPIIAAGAALVAVVALVRKVWTEDWGGIRSWLTSFWNNSLKPIFQSIWKFMSETIPAAIQKLANFWNTVLKPALQTVWAYLNDTVFPLFKAVNEFFDTIFSLTLTAMAGIWENVIQPALESVWEFISKKLQPIFEKLHDFWENTLKPAFENIDFLGTLEKAMLGVRDAIQWVIDKIKALTTKLKNLDLPDWMTPGSPTPWEIGLYGVADALHTLNRAKLPELNTKLNYMPSPMGDLAAVNAAATAAPRERQSRQTTSEIHLHIGTLIADERGLRQLEETLKRYRVVEEERNSV